MHGSRSFPPFADVVATAAASIYIGSVGHLSAGWEDAWLDAIDGRNGWSGHVLTFFALTIMTGLLTFIRELAAAQQDTIAAALSRPRTLITVLGVMAIAVLPEFHPWWHTHLTATPAVSTLPYLLAIVGTTAVWGVALSTVIRLPLTPRPGHRPASRASNPSLGG